MLDKDILASQVTANKFPFPCEGNITLAVRNQDYALGPVMLHLVLAPGSVIPAHRHDGVAEVLYIVEGDFINEGKTHLPGESLHIRQGTVHGPHTTKAGCQVLVLWTAHAAGLQANLADFTVAQPATA